MLLKGAVEHTLFAEADCFGFFLPPISGKKEQEFCELNKRASIISQWAVPIVKVCDFLSPFFL
jgi:hypothetical protein